MLRVLFARCSEWNFGEYYFQENFEDFKKAQSKKVVIPKNTVSCNSRCFWVSRQLVSFLESSEQISRFGAALKKRFEDSFVLISKHIPCCHCVYSSHIYNNSAACLYGFSSLAFHHRVTFSTFFISCVMMVGIASGITTLLYCCSPR